MRLLCPDLVLRSVFELDLQALYKQGIRGILVDLDNTLIRWDHETLGEDFRDWVRRAVSLQLRVCIVSNGLHGRVKQLAEVLEVPYVSKALKPRRKPFRAALKLVGLSPNECVMIGDQLFTDVLGGNLAGMMTVLIDPLSDKELNSTRIVRRFERRMLRRLVRQGLLDEASLAARRGGRGH